MRPDLRLTLATRRVLTTMLDLDGETYAYQIAQETDLPSGTVVPMLARLEEAGILSSRLEAVDASAVGRPARRYYQFTTEGRSYVEGRLV